MTVVRSLFFLSICFCVSGCVGLWPHVEQRHGKSTSMVEFLYPNGTIPPAYEERIPHLELPIDVGLAFLPGGNGRQLTEVGKSDALERVRLAFQDRDYVRSVRVIPSNYVSSVKGVGGIAQLGRTYGVDAVALIAYDQLAMSSERDSAILYWTIVGAYTVKGTRHEVQTFVDAAVIDVKTAKLLLRAPGTSLTAGNATLSDSRRDLRDRQVEGFNGAVDEMIDNLQVELDGFEARIRAGGDADVKVAWRPGFGGGAMGPWLIVLGLIALARRAAPGPTGQAPA